MRYNFIYFLIKIKRFNFEPLKLATLPLFITLHIHCFYYFDINTAPKPAAAPNAIPIAVLLLDAIFNAPSTRFDNPNTAPPTNTPPVTLPAVLRACSVLPTG